jgi:hypothetical protein
VISSTGSRREPLSHDTARAHLSSSDAGPVFATRPGPPSCCQPLSSSAPRRPPVAGRDRPTESRGRAPEEVRREHRLEILERGAAQARVVGLEGPRRDPGGLPLEGQGQEREHVLAQEGGVVRRRELARRRGQGGLSRCGKLGVVFGQREEGPAAASAQLERLQAQAGDQAVAGDRRGAGPQDGGHASPHFRGARGQQRVHELAGRARRRIGSDDLAQDIRRVSSGMSAHHQRVPGQRAQGGPHATGLGAARRPRRRRFRGRDAAPACSRPTARAPSPGRDREALDGGEVGERVWAGPRGPHRAADRIDSRVFPAAGGRPGQLRRSHGDGGVDRREGRPRAGASPGGRHPRRAAPRCPRRPTTAWPSFAAGSGV